MRRILLTTATLLSSFPAFAEPVLDLVITPTRSETPAEQSGSSITVITADEIARKQTPPVADLLRSVAGVDVARAGGPGQTTSVFMRGANSEHTLVLIDGVVMNDPASTSGFYDFSHLSSDNIERIEVLRGNQSTLYGSSAIGGVINIITKKGVAAPSGYTSLEGGSYGTIKGASGISGKVDNTAFTADISQFHTDGFSALDKKFGGNKNDRNDATNFSTRIDQKISDTFSAYTTLHYNEAHTEYDGFDVEQYNTTHAKEISWRGAGKFSLLDGRWDQEIGTSVTTNNRDTNDETYGVLNYRAERVKLDWLNHVKINEHNLATFGAETSNDIASANTVGDQLTSHNQRVNGYFLQDQIQWMDNLYTTIGGRLDDNSIFGNKYTYRIAQSYKVTPTDTLLKASYGTGFKAPSLYQLYSGSYGDPNLKPETSQGVDVGFEQPLFGNKVKLGSTYFYTEFKNLINFDSTFHYFNVNAARTRGDESFIEWTPLPSLLLRANYTYTQAFDTSTGQELLRRPKNKASVEADYSFLEKGRAVVNAVYNGTRSDYDFNGNRVIMPNAVVFNLTGSWQLMPSLQLFGRVDNLLDKRYENVYGNGTAGLSGYTGIKITY